MPPRRSRSKACPRRRWWSASGRSATAALRTWARSLAEWTPWWAWAAFAGVVCVSTAMAGLKVRQFALADPQFRLSRSRPETLSVSGLKYTSRAKVVRVFAADFGHSIFAVPLEERRRRLLGIDWV